MENITPPSSPKRPSLPSLPPRPSLLRQPRRGNSLAKRLFISKPTLVDPSSCIDKSCIICLRTILPTDCYQYPFCTCLGRYHKLCLEEWIKNNDSCPTCRQKFILSFGKRRSKRRSKRKYKSRKRC